MARMSDAAPWGPGEEASLRAAWVTEPPRLDGPVTLAAYDAGWPALFEREAARLRDLLGAGILLLEHVGSTAVPGLAAKPRIDILMVVADPVAKYSVPRAGTCAGRSKPLPLRRRMPHCRMPALL